MILLRAGILVFIFGLLQAVFPENAKLFSAAPDLLLILVFIFGLTLNFWQAFLLGAISGIIKDSFSLSPLGFNALVFSGWAAFIYYISRRVSIEDFISRSLVLLSVALVNNILLGLFLIYSGSLIPLGIFLRLVTVSSLYTAVVFMFSSKIILKWLDLK